MSNEAKVEKWLKENTESSWTRTSGDTPATKLDLQFINRSEGYEIKDLIVSYYTGCNLAFTDENFSKTYGKIIKHNKGQKVTRKDMLTHLKETNSNCTK